MKLFIGMALGRGVLNAETARSILRLSNALARHDRTTELHPVCFAEVSVARDMIAARFLASDCDQLLFVDDDMDFHPQIVADMISIQKPFVGALYPTRSLDLEVFAEAYVGLDGLDGETRFRKAKSAASGFVGMPKAPITSGMKEKFLPASQVGAGLMLLDRSVFGQLLAKDKTLKTGLDPQTRVRITSFFQRIYLAEQDGFLSEDFSFCYRWRNAVKGEIWAYVKGGVGHTGTVRYDAVPDDWEPS